MTVPNIDTFEQDVADEIKRKEASFTDIASASNDVGNAPEQKRGSSLLIPLLLITLFLILAGAGGGYYYLFVLKKPAAPPMLTQPEQTDRGTHIGDISQTIADAVGSSVGTITRSEYGFTIKLQEYAPVFAYMLRNESAYADEIATAVGSPKDTSTTTPPFAFKDVTINNQNMRVGISASSTVVYAFITTSHLVISSSTEGILSLRSAIIK